ncbi:MAG: Alpha/Beta hydrolase protein [Benjaminiella poitrasii]|nr:MAG: Alpha/Beta hydrolase protein [Benjaminiella poitrasii]
MFIKRSCQQFISKRTYSVLLNHEKYSMKSPSTESPIVICHGLFGSKQNWSSLAKAISSRLNRDVYTVDLRNHGDSFHSPTHNYKVMSEDVIRFIDRHQLNQPVLLGHSMGGKAVMATALTYPTRIGKVISVDMPPVALRLSRDFSRYVEAMRAIEEARPRRQAEADRILSQYEKDVGIRMFLLTNLKRQDEVMRFRIPYEILGKALSEVSGFDVAKGAAFEGPTLFVAGGNSPYLKPFDERGKEIKAMFPNSSLEVVKDAGHWVHAEKPDQVLNLLTSFIKQ